MAHTCHSAPDQASARIGQALHRDPDQPAAPVKHRLMQHTCQGRDNPLRRRRLARHPPQRAFAQPMTITHANPMGQFGYVGANFYKNAVRLNENWMVRIECAASAL